MKANNVDSRNTINVFLGKHVLSLPLLFFIDVLLGRGPDVQNNLWNMFQGASGEVQFDFLRVVENPRDADFLLLPHNYFSLKKKLKHETEKYISSCVAVARQYQKKILVFALADSDEHIHIPNSVIFRPSQYGYKKQVNEIIIPPYSPHFRSPVLDAYRSEIWKRISFRTKTEKPTVSFCGWADFPSAYRYLTYGLRLLATDAKKYIFRDRHAELHKRGIYFRRKAIHALHKSSSLNTNFILRKSYSAQKGIDGKKKVRPEDMEREYIENILESDFVLAPKGNGNFSVRFYEALSLGRFPVLINTDCVLPLRKYIDYDKFVVTVEYTEIDKAEQKIIDFYNSLTNEELHKRQIMAREAFELLRPGSFLKIVLSELKERE